MNEILNEEKKDIRYVKIDITKPVEERIVSLYDQFTIKKKLNATNYLTQIHGNVRYMLD